MSETRNTSGWTAIDDGSDVPVRSSSASKVKAGSVVIGSEGVHTHKTTLNGKTEIVTEINPHMMQLSAVTGIGLVLLGAAFYFGIVNLRGSVTTDTTTNPGAVTVTITEQNTFDPAHIDVEEGGSITFENKNQNPQVLKSENPEVSLFPVQVIFKDPISVSIDPGKAGSYTYVSETMPKDQKLTINVTPKSTPVTTPSAPTEQVSDATNPSLSIPLPFDSTTATPPVTAQESVTLHPQESTNSVTPTFVSASQGNETAVISLGQGVSQQEDVAFSNTPIAVNPYTVEEGKKNKNTNNIASDAKKKQSLHSGAPLESLRAHKPYRTASTGPENVWLLLFVAMMGLGVVYARSLQKA